MGFHYDPEQGLLVTALQMKNTVLPQVISRPEYWFFVLFHVLIKSLYCMGFMDSADVEGSSLHADWSTIHVMSLLTMYLAVFYSNSSYENYLNLYMATRFSLGCVYDFAFLIKMTFQKTNLTHMRLAYRYFVSSTYLGLQHAKHANQGSVPDEKMRYLLRNRYLSTIEYRHLSQMPVEDRYMRLQSWATEVIVVAFAERLETARLKPLFKVDLRVLPEMRPLPLENAALFAKAMLASREKRYQMLEILALPIPFQYFHIVTCMVLVNCALWSYKMATNTSFAASFVFLLAQAIYLGMLELAVELANPFGDDDVDLPLDDWIDSCFSHCLAFVESSSPGDEDEWEHALETQGKLSYLPAGQADGGVVSDDDLDVLEQARDALDWLGPRTRSARNMLLSASFEPAGMARQQSGGMTGEPSGGMKRQISSDSSKNLAVKKAWRLSTGTNKASDGGGGFFDAHHDDESEESDCS